MAVVLGAASEVGDDIVARMSAGGSVVVMAPDASTLHAWLEKILELHAGADGDLVAIEHGDLTIDMGAHRALWRGRMLSLTPLEFRLLAALARDIGRAFSFRTLMEELWGPSHFGDAPLRSTIKRLRRKLLDNGVDVVIESVRGVGYRLEASSSATSAGSFN